MKKIICIDILLIFALLIIPTDYEGMRVATKNNKNIIVIEDIEEMSLSEAKAIETSSRSLTSTREEVKKVENDEIVETVEKNLVLTVESDLRNISNLTGQEFDKMLANTELQGIGSAFEQVEKEHGINGLYLLGLACLESNYGKSNFAVERNNLFGWNAVDNNPGKATYFTSKDESILYVAYKLKKNYLTENGLYFNGYTANDINKKYSSDPGHAQKIIQIVDNLKNNI